MDVDAAATAKQRAARKNLLGCAAIMIVLAAGITTCTLIAFDGGEEAATPKVVTRVTDTWPSVVNVEIASPDAPRDGGIIERGGDAIVRFARDLDAGRVAAPAKTISFTITGPRRGDDGGSGERIAHLNYRRDALVEAVKGGADGATILGEAFEGGTWTPSNRDVTNDYCRRTPHSAAFCQRFAG